jgi:hypothetical protein
MYPVPEEVHRAFNMVGAGLGLVGNAVEGAGAVILAATPEPTLLTKVGAVALSGLALDGAQANVRTLYNWGAPTPSLLNQGATALAGYALSPEKAQYVGAGVDFGAHLGGTAYSGLLIKGAVGTRLPVAPKSISTGRTVPNRLNEQLAMEEVMANPGGKQLPIKMSDTANNLLAEDGWVKMAQNVNGAEIHYVKNTRTGQVVDFKFKD